MSTVSQKCQLSPGVQLSRTGDRCVLFNEKTGTAIVLNPTGTILAGLLENPRSEADLAGELEKRFDGLSNAQAAVDTAAFLKQLQEHKMLVSL
jgi:hypothetical protein